MPWQQDPSDPHFLEWSPPSWGRALAGCQVQGGRVISAGSLSRRSGGAPQGQECVCDSPGHRGPQAGPTGGFGWSWVRPHSRGALSVTAGGTPAQPGGEPAPQARSGGGCPSSLPLPSLHPPRCSSGAPSSCSTPAAFLAAARIPPRPWRPLSYMVSGVSLAPAQPFPLDVLVTGLPQYPGFLCLSPSVLLEGKS